MSLVNFMVHKINKYLNKTFFLGGFTDVSNVGESFGDKRVLTTTVWRKTNRTNSVNKSVEVTSQNRIIRKSMECHNERTPPPGTGMTSKENSITNKTTRNKRLGRTTTSTSLHRNGGRERPRVQRFRYSLSKIRRFWSVGSSIRTSRYEDASGLGWQRPTTTRVENSNNTKTTTTINDDDDDNDKQRTDRNRKRLYETTEREKPNNNNNKKNDNRETDFDNKPVADRPDGPCVKRVITYFRSAFFFPRRRIFAPCDCAAVRRDATRPSPVTLGRRGVVVSGCSGIRSAVSRSVGRGRRPATTRRPPDTHRLSPSGPTVLPTARAPGNLRPPLLSDNDAVCTSKTQIRY